MTAAPVPAPPILVLAERGGTQIKAPKAVLLIDTREQNPLDCSRFALRAGLPQSKSKPSHLATTRWLDSKMSARWNGRTCLILFAHLPRIVQRLYPGLSSRRHIVIACSGLPQPSEGHLPLTHRVQLAR
jgi:hypothetical protein